MEIEVVGNSSIPGSIPYVNPLVLLDTEINIVLFKSTFDKWPSLANMAALYQKMAVTVIHKLVFLVCLHISLKVRTMLTKKRLRQ